jgi:hypothetical protein
MRASRHVTFTQDGRYPRTRVMDLNSAFDQQSPSLSLQGLSAEPRRLAKVQTHQHSDFSAARAQTRASRLLMTVSLGRHDMTVASRSGARQCAAMAERELQHLERAVRVAHAQGFVVVSMGIDYWRFRLTELMRKFDLTPNQSERVEMLALMLGR